MKARKEALTLIKEPVFGSDEQKRSRKLKPIKKEKNQRQSLFQEIDELEDIEMSFKKDLLEEEEFYADEEDN